MRSHMDVPVTIAVCAALLALSLVAGWRGARPPNPHRGPRMVPWRFIMLLSAAAFLGGLTWLASLLGLLSPH
jgi:hypothetical protein